MERIQGRCPASGRHRPLLRLVLAGVALVAACSPLPEPSGPSATPPPASPSTPPSQGTTPTTGGSPSPISAEDRLVVLAQSDTGSHLVTWRDGKRIAVPLPGPDAYGLDIDGTGRAAVVAGGDIFVADDLTRDNVQWSPVAEFRPDPGTIVTGLAWSPDGALAWTAAREPAVPPFLLVAGLPGQRPTRIGVRDNLDGPPTWLDAERIAVPVVHDPRRGLLVVSVSTAETGFVGMPACLASAADGGLVALAFCEDPEAPRIEIWAIADLDRGAGSPLAVAGAPDAAYASSIAFSKDGRWMAVAWVGHDNDFSAIAFYDREAGWTEGGRLEGPAIGLPSGISVVELAWLP